MFGRNRMFMCFMYFNRMNLNLHIAIGHQTDSFESIICINRRSEKDTVLSLEMFEM